MSSKILMVGLIFALSCQWANAFGISSGADQKLVWEVIRKFNVIEMPLDIAHSLDGKYAFVLTGQSTIKVFNQAGDLQGSIPVDKGVNAITIAPQGEFLHLTDSRSNTYYTVALDFVLDINTANAPTKGSIDAPVTIAVFSDFQ